MDEKENVFFFVDNFINRPKRPYWWRPERSNWFFSERLDRYIKWEELLALEDRVGEWTKEHPVIWNVGNGPAASFVPTFTRLLFQRTEDIYGPYDHIVRVRLPSSPSAAAASWTTDDRKHWLAFHVLRELATTLLGTPLPEDIKQLGEEESYFGYCKISYNLILQAFGKRYINRFWSDRSGKEYSMRAMDPIYDRQPDRSPILVERIREALQQKSLLLLIESVHIPPTLDVLTFIMGGLLPSISRNRRWLISTTSKDVCERSRHAGFHILDYSSPLYHPWSTLPSHYDLNFWRKPYDDLRERDWAMLIKEALRDAARSIDAALQGKKGEEFWLQVAQRCLYYAILYHPLQGQGASGHQASNTSSVTSDELVRCWVAENLIFPPASPADTPAATNQKQSNNYRSAFEAGKVVIQALQEYSLLPIYSDSTPTVSTSSCEESSSTESSSSDEETTSVSSPQDRITGVSKLAEGVPRLGQDGLNVLTETGLVPWPWYISISVRWVSFMNGHGRNINLDWGSPRKIRGDMSTLILRGCSNMSAFPLDKMLTPQLRVLDLSYTPINSLPPSFSNLLNLYLLSLRGCSQLETLSAPPSNSDKQTSPLAHLENLQVLDMNGVPLLQLTQQDGSKKSNLHYLDLSGSKFTTLPPKFFCEMSSLEELIFGNCTNLRELPPSVAQLSKLLVLHIEGTQITSLSEHIFPSLHTLKLTNNTLLMSLPVSLSEAKCLKELHISNCTSLRLQALWELPTFLENLYIQTWEGLEDIKILGHPNLRIFSLSGPWVRCLSLRGCSKLTSVSFNDDLTALEDVDLSRTAIEEVPHNLPNLPQLNMLLLIGVPCFMRFPWHQLVRFPKVFYLDHCGNDDYKIPKRFYQQRTCGDENRQEEETTNTAQVNINDPRMFHSFNKDAVIKLVNEGKFLLSFNVQVKPCSVRAKGPRNIEGESSTRMQRHSTYHDVQYSALDTIMPMMKLQPMQRHVEISAVSQYPYGLRHILSVTDSVFITDDTFVRSLTDLNYSLMCLEECKLQRCHQMTVTFKTHSYGTHALPVLRVLQVFHLNNLLSLVEPSRLSYSTCITLDLLKHVHLEQCPRLEKVFPCSLSLPALETLVILFCSNLKTIFYGRGGYEVEPSPLPNIKRIHLQELPQLLHIHYDVTFRFETPWWEKLFVRGCHCFHHLPLLKREYLKTKVEVNGEREWWDRLQLKLPEQSDYYMHAAPPEFVSRKKHIIQSYLR